MTRFARGAYKAALESVQPAISQPNRAEEGGSCPRALALALAVVACYANSLRVPFLLDDPQPGTRLDYSTRPLVWASFDLNRALSGAETWSFHVFNALVHLACGLLFFGILRRAMAAAAPRLAPRARTDLAFVAALLWLCHPLQTAAVTYLSQRAESLGALFTLAVLYSFQRAAAAERPRAWQALALVALALGFLAKETVATAPVIVWLYDALFLARGPLAALRARPVFYAALALVALGLGAVYVVPLLAVEGSTAGLLLPEHGPLEYLRTQPGVILHYLRLAFWPHPLCFDYGWPIARAPLEYVPQSAAVLALLAASLVLLARRSWLGFAGTCFFLLLAPTSSFVPIRDVAFEHRMYLPLAAVVVVAVAGAWRLLARAPRARPIAAAAAALVLAGLTVRRNHDYRSALHLMEVTVACAPHNPRARANLGAMLLDANRPEEAIPVLLDSARFDPDPGLTYLNLGAAYMRLQKPELAIAFFRRAVETTGEARCRDALAQALLLKGEPGEAALYFAQALELTPDDAGLHFRLARALRGAGRIDEALPHYEEALRLDPGLADAHTHLSELLLERGSASEALEHARGALSIAPDSALEHFNLGQALHVLGRFAEAADAFRAAIPLLPGQPEPYAAFASSVCARPDATRAELEEARRMAAQANELVGSSRADLLEVEAKAAAALGDFAQAAALLERALALPDAPGRLRAQRDDYRAKAGE